MLSHPECSLGAEEEGKYDTGRGYSKWMAIYRYQIIIH
jgi:hypothetical protein